VRFWHPSCQAARTSASSSAIRQSHPHQKSINAWNHKFALDFNRNVSFQVSTVNDALNATPRRSISASTPYPESRLRTPAESLFNLRSALYASTERAAQQQAKGHVCYKRNGHSPVATTLCIKNRRQSAAAEACTAGDARSRLMGLLQ
jgi:hypothetical protein